MTDYGATDTSTTSLGTNQFPANSVFIPGDTKLTVVGGANKATDVNGKTYADALTAVADGHNVTLGAKADAANTATDTTAITIMAVLKQISKMLQAPASTPVTGTVTSNAGTNLNTSLLALEAGGNLASLVTNTADLLADGDFLATLGSKTDAKSTATDATSISIMQVLKEISAMVQAPASTPVTGTFWQATQPTSIVDGSLATLGAKADAKNSATDATAITAMQVLKQISYMLQNPVALPATPVTESGTWTVQPGNTQNTTPWLTFPGITLTTLSAWNSSTGSNATQTIYTNSGASAALVQLDQTTTLTGGAITFEVSYDGINWGSPPANSILDPTSATYAQIANPYTLQASTNKPFLLVSNGWQALRIRLSTVISGTGTVTPYYALLAFNPVQQSVVYSPTAANFQATATQGGTWTVQQGGSNWSENVTQFGGTNLSTGTGAGGAGIPRVTVSNDSTVGANSATGSAVPANAFSVGGLAKTALPAAASDGNLTGEMLDKFGRIVVVPETVRDLKSNIPGLTLTTTGETTLIAAVASTFNDITGIVCENTSATAVRVDFRDSTAGTIQFSLYLPAGDTRGFSNMFYKQTTVNQNWTAQLSGAVTDVRIYGTYVANK